MSKYEALRGVLEARADEEIVLLKFDELDAILRGLPASARRHKTWWTNNAASQPHAACWLDAGRLAEPQLQNRCAVFVRAPAIPEDRDHERGARAVPNRGLSEDPARPRGESVVDVLGRAELQMGFEWQHVGVVGWDGKPTFPVLSSAPGIYAFLFVARGGDAGRVYVGQAQSLRGRMRGYRNPAPEGSGQLTNRRLSAEIGAHLASSGQVHVFTARTILLGGVAADLSVKALRGLFEAAAICDLAQRGFVLLNR